VKNRRALLGLGLGALSTTLSLLLFFDLLGLGIGIIKTNKGLAAFGGLASLILLALGELVFIMLVFEHYGKAKEPRRLLKRFCSLTAAVCFLLAITVGLRFLLLLPAFRAAGLPPGRVLVLRDYLQGGAWLALGAILVLLPKWLRAPGEGGTPERGTPEGGRPRDTRPV
jgi:hypothetical protein